MKSSLLEGQLYYGGFRAEFEQPSDAERWKAEIRETCVEIPSPGQQLTTIELFEACGSLARRHLSPRPQGLASQFANRSSQVDAIVFSGLPHEDPGPIPLDGRRPLGKTSLSEAVLIGTAEILGLHVFGYQQEKEGSLVHEISPIGGREKEQSSASRKLLGWHTDGGCFFPYQPECLLLLGLVNQSVSTLYLTIDEIIAHTNAGLIDTLRKTIFTFFSPRSFDFACGRCISDRRPVIFTDQLGIDRITLPARDMMQFDNQASDALEEFHEHLDTLTPHEIVIRETMCVAWRNDRVIHGRGPIGDTDERWLQRVYGTSDITKYRQATGMLAPNFAFDARLLFGKQTGQREQLLAAPHPFIEEVLHESISIQ